MLTYLQAKNIALIEEVSLSLDDKLNIFTGETGAGKSMIIDSIQFAIGNRTSKQIIRKGQDYAYAKLVFRDDIGKALEYLQEQNITYKDKVIEIERYLYQSGRTVYKVNGFSVNRQTVRDLSTLLIDVHGQHEPQSLLDVSTHIVLLDSFGSDTYFEKRIKYSRLYEQWQKLKHDLEKVDISDRKLLQLKDMLTFQISEISAAGLTENEEENLKEEYEIKSHAEKIMLSCQKTYDFLEGGQSLDEGAIAYTGKAAYALSDIALISEELRNIYEQLLSIEAQLQDVAYEVRKYTEGIEYSPELLHEIQSRLDLIYKLKQKYGNSVEDILEYKKQCESELKELLEGESNKELLIKNIEETEKELMELSDELSKQRKQIALKIEEEIDKHLHDLQMPHAKFEIAINELDSFNKNGRNDVEFLIRTNLGDDMHPLSKIASGGEISRVMLAIKTVLVLGDTISTVIFDEIDTGISGVTAQKVAQKLAVISRNKQVICITHLPQIAAMGDKNYLIEKEAKGERTTTHLLELEKEHMDNELCRLMGGIITESTLASAREIREIANQYKKNIITKIV